MNNILICDGSYSGLLTAIFEAHKLRPMPIGILLAPPKQQDMLANYIFIETDTAKSQRVQIAIDHKLSPSSSRHVELAYASATENAGTLLLRYLRLGWQVGAALDEYMTHPDVLPVHKLSRKVGAEIHRLCGLVRFSTTESGIFYSAISPDFSVVPALANHFYQRLADQSWILHDIVHGIAAMYKPGVLKIIDCGNSEMFERGQDEYTDLWRTFYQAIAIKSRENPKLRLNHMPKRYWKHMTEFETPSSGKNATANWLK